ncbi:MAG: extracellular solute-binding protein [Candidatus Eisenbacteria bacterium]|jgi:ABC-type glycerol-3-phosphate transport system substrate-binding protein|nr:extracellular solute-binding protein [Candidatus Eisenbacteria bacterium]
MTRHHGIAMALAILTAGCGHRRAPLEAMLPPWFSPDATHPSVQRVFDEYRETQPDFSLRFGPGKANLLLEKLLLMAKEGHLPDVIMFKTAWTKDLAARGILKPLPMELAEAVRTNVMDVLLPVVQGDEYVWAVPYDMDVRLIHYRRDLVDSTGLPPPRIGWTYEEFTALARALTRDTNGDGAPDIWGFAAPGARSQSSVAQLLPWAWSLGAELSERTEWRVDQPALARALGIYSTLRDSLGVAPPDLHVLEQADVYQGVVSGRFAMAEGGSWEIRMIRGASIHADHLAQAVLPSIDGAEPVSCSDGWAFGLATADPERSAAVTPLLLALFSESHQLQKLHDHGWLPTLRQGATWVEKELGVEVAWSLLRCRPVPGGEGWMRASAALVDAMQETLAGGIDPTVALKNAQDRLEMLNR